MNDQDLNIFISEYEREEIGPQLYGLVSDIAKHIVVRYPPQLYSPNKVWDEDAIQGLVTDFLMKRLVPQRLEHHLYTLETVATLRRVVANEFRQFLLNQIERSHLQNLYLRVKKILTEDKRFQIIRNSNRFQEILWVFSGDKGNTEIQNAADVIHTMYLYQLPPIIRYSKGEKLSPLLSNAELKNLLIYTLQTLDAPVTVNLLMEGLQYRLGLLETHTAHLEDKIGSAQDDSAITIADYLESSIQPDTSLIALETAENVFAKLTNRQRDVIALLLSGNSTLEAMGQHLNISKSTVSNEIRTIVTHLKGMNLSDEEFDATIATLSQMCIDDSIPPITH